MTRNRYDAFLVVCECGYADSYESHAAASSAQAGHATGCKGSRTMIFEGETKPDESVVNQNATDG